MRGSITRVEQIDQQVGEDEDGRDDQDRALHHRIVAVQDALDQHPAQTLDGKDVLHHDRARHQQGKGDADHRDHRDQRIGKGVAQQSAARSRRPLDAATRM